MRRVDYHEVADLAATLLGMSDNSGIEDIEQALFDKFEVSFEQFQAVVEALVPFTVKAETALSGEVFQGFVKDNAFILKVPVSNN